MAVSVSMYKLAPASDFIPQLASTWFHRHIKALLGLLGFFLTGATLGYEIQCQLGSYLRDASICSYMHEHERK